MHYYYNFKTQEDTKYRTECLMDLKVSVFIFHTKIGFCMLLGSITYKNKDMIDSVFNICFMLLHVASAI